MIYNFHLELIYKFGYFADFRLKMAYLCSGRRRGYARRRPRFGRGRGGRGGRRYEDGEQSESADQDYEGDRERGKIILF